jgi:hypothetical protein
MGAHLLGHVALQNLVEALGGGNENRGGVDAPEEGVRGGASSDDPAILASMRHIFIEQFTPFSDIPRMDAQNVIVMCRVKSVGLLPILHWFNVYMVDGQYWFSFNSDRAVLMLTRENLELYGVIQIRKALIIFKKGKGHLPAPPPSCKGMKFWRMVTGTDCLHHAWANAVGYKGTQLKLPTPTGGGQKFHDFFTHLPLGFAFRGIKLGMCGGPNSFDTLGMRLYAYLMAR